MAVNLTAREQQRLQEIAHEYREQGYDVMVTPTRDQLPDSLAPFRLDMIARNAMETVVVEVRTQESLTQSPELDAIAQAIDGKPGWRFELVVTNPKESKSKLGKDSTLLDRPEIVYRLHEVRQLSEQEHGEAALLLVWTVIEALLRRLAQEENISLQQDNSMYLAKSLFTYGLLDKEQYEILQQGLEARNTIVHGYKGTQSYTTILSKLQHVADQLAGHAVSS
jgi:uncharacterized protein YutE (UPF0331/DUF86 family)